MSSHLKRPPGDSGWVVSSFGESSVQASEGENRETKSKRSTASRGIELATRPSLKSGVLKSGDRTSSCNVLWVDKYQPQHSEDQLAIHKKKYQDVRGWFEAQQQQNVMTRSRGISTSLLLTGPAGAGKSATVRLIAKQLCFDVREWINKPGVVAHFPHGQQQFDESQAITFRDFLLRTGQYSSQIFVGDDYKKKLILIEDFPATFLSRVMELHSILRLYFKVSRCTTVFVVTDSASSASNERTLFPAHFQEENDITHISFNPIAPTNMVRALKAIAEAENLDISKETLESLVESSRGDIRSAVNALQFTCDVGATTTTVRPKKANVICAKSRTRRGQPEKTRIEIPIVSTTAARDDSLFLFHVLGKILHCKRDTEVGRVSSTSTSNRKESERFPLLVNPEEVWERSSTSASTFSAFLHENYPPFFTDIADVDRVSEYFSLSDVFLGDWAGISVLHLYAVSVSTRGIMYLRKDRFSGGFRPLHKPMFSSVQKSRAVNMDAARNLFAAKYFNLSLGDLFSDVVPYLGKYMASALTQAQKSFIGNNFQPFSGRTVAKQQWELLKEKEFESSAAEAADNSDRLMCEHFTDDNAEVMMRLSETHDDEDFYNIEDFDD